MSVLENVMLGVFQNQCQLELRMLTVHDVQARLTDRCSAPTSLCIVLDKCVALRRAALHCCVRGASRRVIVVAPFELYKRENIV